MTLTERQKRELEYHREHAELHSDLLQKPVCFDVVQSESRRWWNAHWEMYTYLIDKDLRNKNVLVIGCGFGDDTFYLSKAGANVWAFDLSPDSLVIAKVRSRNEGLKIVYQEMPAETLEYENNFFDFVIAVDILHHVDIPKAVEEIERVSKPNAIFCFNEIYSHSITDRIRHSTLVERWLYPLMVNFVYKLRKGEKPYVTEDERKLTEKDLTQILILLPKPEITKYFNFLVTRIVPQKFVIMSKIDRVLLVALSPFAKFLGGRVLMAGPVYRNVKG